jgi:hypothetical protein
MSNALGFSLAPGGRRPWLETWLHTAKAICLTLFMHAARRPASRAELMAGNNRPMRMPMMAITTSNSISVKPILPCFFIPGLLLNVETIMSCSAIRAKHQTDKC